MGLAKSWNPVLLLLFSIDCSGACSIRMQEHSAGRSTCLAYSGLLMSARFLLTRERSIISSKVFGKADRHHTPFMMHAATLVSHTQILQRPLLILASSDNESGHSDAIQIREQMENLSS